MAQSFNMMHFLFCYLSILLPFLLRMSIGFEESPRQHFTYVGPSAIAGLGVFAKTFIPKGTIWYLANSDNALIFSPEQYKQLESSNTNNLTEGFLHYIRTYGICDKKTSELIVLLDNGKYINHSLNPNSGLPEPYNAKISIALRDIFPDEEIVENYVDYMCSWDRVHVSYFVHFVLIMHEINRITLYCMYYRPYLLWSQVTNNFT